MEIKIAGRTYPLSVDDSQVEGLLRMAKEIEIHMDKLREKYAIKDSQDVLAMTLLEYASRLETKKETESSARDTKMLQEVDAFLDQLA